MKNKLLLSLGSSLLVFAPIATVVACGDDSSTTDAFTQYVNNIKLSAPQGAGTKTIAQLDAIVTRTATPVAVNSQTVADGIKDDLGLSVFTINSVNTNYTITYQLRANETQTPGQVKGYIMTVFVKNTETNITKNKTVVVNSSDLVPVTTVGTTQSALDALVGTVTISNMPEHQNKTIAQLDAIVTSSAAGVALTADEELAMNIYTNIFVNTFVKPADVNFTYVLTKNNNDAVGAKQSYSLVITARTTAGLTSVKPAHKVVSSENAPLTIQGIADSFTYTSLESQSILQLDALVVSTANYSPFNGMVAMNYFVGNNIVNLISAHPTVTWTYKVTKGTTATSGKQPYNFEIKASKTSPTESASKNIVYNSSDDVPAAFTQEMLATYVNTTITNSAPADKTIATLNTYVSVNTASLTPSVATALGLNLGTTPNGVTLTYTLTKGTETEGSTLDFTLTVIGAYSGLTNVTKAAITITSSDNVLHPDQVAVNADKAAFNTIFGSSYNETAITTVPETSSTVLADAVTPAYSPSNGSTVAYVLSNRVFNLANETASITVTTTFTKGDKIATHTLDVQYTTLKNAMLQLNLAYQDIIAKAGSNQGNNAIYPEEHVITEATPITEVITNGWTPNANIDYSVTSCVNNNTEGKKSLVIKLTHKTITTLTKNASFEISGYKAGNYTPPTQVQ